MTTEQLEQLKTMVENAGDLPEAAKAKLLELLAQTPADSGDSAEEPQDAQSQWMSSIGELEAAHPEATGFMNRLATTLANMGI